MGKSPVTDLTQGAITQTLLRFTFPMMIGTLLQQCYNLADTLIVGQFIGASALAAVGSAYTLIVFLTSVVLGLSMGCCTVFSIHYGANRPDVLRQSIFVAFTLVGAVALGLNIAIYAGMDALLRFLQVPADVYEPMYHYLWIVCSGFMFVFLYNFLAALLRAIGDSVTPLRFLALSVVLNILLDLFCIVVLDWGLAGAAWATVAAQIIAALGLTIHVYKNHPELCWQREDMKFSRTISKDILAFSSLTCIQQSVMNFGILLVQGLINSFGTAVMAAFAIAVKIDSFAYMPVQEFGNAFSIFVAQNFGAKQPERIRRGTRNALLVTVCFSLLLSLVVVACARPLMLLFISPSETEIIAIGVTYLRIEGAFYVGIGILFLLYGYYRAVRRPGMSVVLTVISLGTRVALSYYLVSVPGIGLEGIWWSIPVGWLLADLTGFWYYRKTIQSKSSSL